MIKYALLHTMISFNSTIDLLFHVTYPSLQEVQKLKNQWCEMLHIPTPQALVTAVRENNHKKVRDLVHRGVSLEAVEHANGYTPLQSALFSENYEMARLLIKLGAHYHPSMRGMDMVRKQEIQQVLNEEAPALQNSSHDIACIISEYVG